MKRLLLILVFMAVAISGCMEEGPGEKALSASELQVQAVNSADNLSSYSLISSANQTLELNTSAANATSANVTTIMESVTTAASVNLSAYTAKASGLTRSRVEVPGQAANSSSLQADFYQIGNSTYVHESNGNWTHLKDPRSAEEIWGSGNNNQVKTLANSINQSSVQIVGSEMIEGEDTYKLEIMTGSGEYNNLYTTAFSLAAKMIQYPMLIPSINSTELNETSEMEKLVWISKETNMPRKYMSSMSFKMTPSIVGGMDPSTGQMKMFNQSVRMGQISVNIETTDLYYDFNKPTQIVVPEDALLVKPMTPEPIQVVSQT